MGTQAEGRRSACRERRAVGARDTVTAARIIGAAFDEDPTWSFVFSDPARRLDQYQRFWELLVDGAQRCDWVWLCDADHAVTVWLPPGCNELSDEQEAGFAEFARSLLGLAAPRLLETVERFATARPSDPHYYLSLFATDPQHAGHGYGMALLAQNLLRIDEVGAAAYLESTNPLNLNRYRGVGFEVTGSFDLPDSGPSVTTMWREPRRAVAPSTRS
ncbi:MAG: GNAT family N-acetyltransferase [Actinomycetes bacterium]